jgi:hypothetical protein
LEEPWKSFVSGGGKASGEALQNAHRQRNSMRDFGSFILLPFDFMPHHCPWLCVSAGEFQARFQARLITRDAA